MGLLRAAASAPFLLIGLLAGVWVDRHRRRPILLATNLGRALVLAVIPLAALLGVVRIELLYVVAFVAGTLTVFFDVAYVSYLPVLAHREHLVEGNSKLEMSRSFAQIRAGCGGRSGAGGRGAVRHRGGRRVVPDRGALRLAHPRRRAGGLDRRRAGVRAEVMEGLQTIVGNPVLRSSPPARAPSTCSAARFRRCSCSTSCATSASSRPMTGLLLMASGPGALVGALLASRIADRIGVGPTICGAAAVAIVPAP